MLKLAMPLGPVPACVLRMLTLALLSVKTISGMSKHMSACLRARNLRAARVKLTRESAKVFFARVPALAAKVYGMPESHGSNRSVASNETTKSAYATPKPKVRGETREAAFAALCAAPKPHFPELARYYQELRDHTMPVC